MSPHIARNALAVLLLAPLVLLAGCAAPAGPVSGEEADLLRRAIAAEASTSRTSAASVQSRLLARINRSARGICIELRNRPDDYRSTYCYNRGPAGWTKGYEGRMIIN